MMTVQSDPNGDELELVSMYLNPAAGRPHGISLRLGPEQGGSRKGMLWFDPNHCGLNAWGDRTGCTKMGSHPLPIETIRMRTLDPAGHGRVLHRIASAAFDREQANLIQYPAAGLWYLVYERQENGTWVIPLFAAALFRANPAGTIAMRSGPALREVIEHGDVEEMKLEAKLVRDALEALDAEPQLPTGRNVGDAQIAEARKALGELEAALAALTR
jgi:hypothetical protein